MAPVPGIGGSVRPRRPPNLGSVYAKVLSAAAVSYIGDGVYYTALPLLAATITRDPLRVATVEVAGQLPWLLFALPAGALVDRWDRRRILWPTDAYRLEVLGQLQRRGVGTALIHAAEDHARSSGHDRIALAVGLDNRNARRLYEHLGYVDWG
jgi:GNAT superfamily N-acetyltransferase